MRKRWRWILVFVLLAGLLLPLAFPVPRYCLLGWLRDEAWYGNRPTSYWRYVVESVEADYRHDQKPSSLPPRMAEWWGKVRGYFRSGQSESAYLFNNVDPD